MKSLWTRIKISIPLGFHWVFFDCSIFAMDYLANLQGFECNFEWILAPLYNIIDELKIVSWW